MVMPKIGFQNLYWKIDKKENSSTNVLMKRMKDLRHHNCPEMSAYLLFIPFVNHFMETLKPALRETVN